VRVSDYLDRVLRWLKRLGEAVLIYRANRGVRDRSACRRHHPVTGRPGIARPFGPDHLAARADPGFPGGGCARIMAAPNP
jgi:hypothetical protein